MFNGMSYNRGSGSFGNNPLLSPQSILYSQAKGRLPKIPFWHNVNIFLELRSRPDRISWQVLAFPESVSHSPFVLYAFSTKIVRQFCLAKGKKGKIITIFRKKMKLC